MKTKNLFLATILTFFGIVSQSSAQATSSNSSNTTLASDYLGSSNNSVTFRSNANFAGFLNGANTSFGVSTGNAYQSTFVGANAGKACSGGNGVNNVFVGYNSGLSNTTGQNSVYIGFGAGAANTVASNNIFIGNSAGQSFNGASTGADNNIYIGNGSGNFSTTGTKNVFLGGQAGSGTTSNPNTGTDNTFLGYYAGFLNSTGIKNSYVGEAAGQNNTTGIGNSALGYQAGNTVTTGSGNISIGMGSAQGLTTGSNNTIIGSATVGSNINNTIILSDGGSAANQRLYIHGGETVDLYKNGNTGIGLGNNVIPQNRLEVKSYFTNSATQSSGLRLTNLKNTITPITNTTNGVLSVDANGDVIFVNDKVGTGGTGTTTNTLTSSGNTLTSTVNGVIASAPIVNTVVNTISGNDLVTAVNGVSSTSITLPAYTDHDQQTLSISTNTTNHSYDVSISNGNTINVPMCYINPTGTDITVTGDGTQTNPYVINSNATGGGNNCNIYSCDGTIVTNPIGVNNPNPGLRTVTMGNNNLFFQTNPINDGNGRVYIGAATAFNGTSFGFPNITPTSTFRLMVEGGILSERVKVALRNTNNWADYVFAKDYQLTPLNEIETYIKENKHLPGIESAETIVKEGLDLGEMQAKQMGKIEELTLYTIDQQKQLDQQSKEIEELKAQVKALLEKKN